MITPEHVKKWRKDCDAYILESQICLEVPSEFVLEIYLAGRKDQMLEDRLQALTPSNT